MQELFDRGHVYIAVPPLYLVKLGQQETYLVKDSQLEELLVREKFPDLEVTARDGTAVKLTETKYARFQKALADFSGWSARLRSDFGADAADFVITRGVIESEAKTPAEVAKLAESLPAEGYELSVLRAAADGVQIKVVETETSAAYDVTIPSELLVSPVYDHVRRTHERLREVTGGLPPFTLKLGKHTADAATFEHLRDRAIELAKEGIQLSRFKGLGEMNYQQLWDTTMDPQRRMLVRVDVEDASRADMWFSRLMGDEVEPRRVFIEQNAQDVRFLDV